VPVGGDPMKQDQRVPLTDIVQSNQRGHSRIV
jgi:hypothetical protein